MDSIYPASEWRRIMRIHDVFNQAYRHKLTWKEAAEVLGVDPRTVRRWKQTAEAEGLEALLDGRKSRPSPKRIPDEYRSQVKKLYQDQYRDWNVKHFHEQLHKYRLPYSYTWTKNLLQQAHLVPTRTQRKHHRSQRPRTPLPGMMLHIDGSEHPWIPHLAPRTFSMIVVMDDATSRVYYAKLVKEEDTRECMAAIRHVVASCGLFCSLYSDRASHFFFTPKTGAKVDPSRPTQLAKALNELGITMIPAYSPEARGRSERINGTWQGRLPNELKFHKIKTLTDANRYLWEQFIPWYNQSLTVEASSKGSAFSPYQGKDLDLIFSIKDSRRVQADNTLRWNNKVLQLEPSALRISFAKAKVIVHEHLDRTLSVRFGPHSIGRFDHNGKSLKTKNQAHRGAKKTRPSMRTIPKKRTNHLLQKPDILTCH